MNLFSPLRAVVDNYRLKRTVRSVEANATIGVVKQALASVTRPSSQERKLMAKIERQRPALTKIATDVKIGEDTMALGTQVERSSTARPAADFLFQLIRAHKPVTALELGTCAGISASYFASAMQMNGKGHLWTIEGVPDVAKLAQKTFSALGLSSRVTQIVGWFADTLEPTLSQHGPFDFSFIDGNHKEAATIEYFQQVRPHMARSGLMVFDDITWSDGMKRAWTVIKQQSPDCEYNSIGVYGIVQIGGSGAGTLS